MHTELQLPDPIAAYFAADRRGPDAVAACFTPQAVVTDEGRTHHGRDAIKAWKQAAAGAYEYEVHPFALDVEEGGAHVVRSRVTGTFPGSPVDLRYRFRLERGLVAALEVKP